MCEKPPKYLWIQGLYPFQVHTSLYHEGVTEMLPLVPRSRLVEVGIHLTCKTSVMGAFFFCMVANFNALGRDVLS